MREEFTGNEMWDDDMWKTALLKLFKMKKSSEGRAGREQLVIYGQIMYNCVICGLYI